MSAVRRGASKERKRPNARWRRLQKEFDDISNENYENISVSLVDDNLQEWRAMIDGPIGTPYEDGRWILSIQFGQDYPHKCPSVSLITPILHVNIGAKGKHICLSVFDEWDDDNYVIQILLDFYAILKEPDFVDVLNGDLKKQHETNEQIYNEMIRKHTRQHARQNGGTNNNNNNNNGNNNNGNNDNNGNNGNNGNNNNNNNNNNGNNNDDNDDNLKEMTDINSNVTETENDEKNEMNLVNNVSNENTNTMDDFKESNPDLLKTDSSGTMNSSMKEMEHALSNSSYLSHASSLGTSSNASGTVDDDDNKQ